MGLAAIWQTLPYLLQAARSTIFIAALTILFATCFGLFGAVLNIQGGRLSRAVLSSYVYVVRGIPILVQVFLVYFGLPFAGIHANRYVVAVSALTLYMGALMLEVFRGALLAVPRGQSDAGFALGMTPWLLMWQVLLPQALKAALPPYVSLLPVTVKATSLVSIIDVWELTSASKEMTARTLATFPIFGTSFVIYFALCFPLAYLGSRLERRLTSAAKTV